MLAPDSAEVVMHIGSILRIGSHGEVAIQLSDRVVHAQIMTGGGNLGDLVEGHMSPGIQTWSMPPFRTMLVNVFAAGQV
jgi:hypothetical protein